MDYVYIRAWGLMMGSNRRYIEAQVAKARADEAPEDATFYRDDTGWHTFQDVTRESTRDELAVLVEGIRQGAKS